MTAVLVSAPPPLRRMLATVPPRRHAVVLPAVQRLPTPPVPSQLTGWQGPNPYGEFTRTFTNAGGIRLSFKVRDPQLWRTIVRALLWLLTMAATLWFLSRASPYLIIPRGCGVTRLCSDGLVATHILIDGVLAVFMAVLYAWVLFFDDEALASIEIRTDCMIIDDADVFWRERMDLGWPQIVPGGEGSFVLRGVYGTREIDYLTLHAFDEKDRAVQVLGAQLQFAMQQLWDQPGAGR